MRWNSRNKLNFVQCFKQIHTHTHTHKHTHTHRVHSQKQKKRLNYTQGDIQWMVDDASVLLGVSLFGTEFFCHSSLNLSCDYFLGKA
jgi:hypothetical protein